MESRCFRFDRFRLDTGDRRLERDGEPIELNSRYLDALALLVSEQGKLVSKERFLGVVWNGIPVTDEALTQCIKTLRRQLGDDAASPRFIETVPKHGYRFIAPVERHGERIAVATRSGRDVALAGLAGTIGGGLAGLVGGLVYGFVGASQPLAPGVGAFSALLVILCLCIAVALTGAAGVAFGIAAAGRLSRQSWGSSLAGGALGGLLVGGAVKLLGLDAFNLLVGGSPGDITGAAEGAILGGAVGIAWWFAIQAKRLSLRRAAAIAAVAGGSAGLLIPLLGGRLMAGSLDLFAESFPGSRLRMDRLGALLGEEGFGPVSAMVTGVLEGMLFSTCLVVAMLIADNSLANGKTPRR